MISSVHRHCIKQNLCSKINNILSLRCEALFKTPGFSDLMMVDPHTVLDVAIPNHGVPIIRLINRKKSYPVQYKLPAEIRMSPFPSVANRAIRTHFGLEMYDEGIEFKCDQTGEILQIRIRQPSHSIPVYKDWYPEIYDQVYAYAALVCDFEALTGYVRYLYTTCTTYNQMEHTLPGVKQFFRSDMRGISGRTTKPYLNPLPTNLHTCWAILNLE